MSTLRNWIDWLCPPSASEIAAERKALIEKRRREVRFHRPVASIDARLIPLTNLQLRQNRKRFAWGRGA